jgi:hypothetical protein
MWTRWWPPWEGQGAEGARRQSIDLDITGPKNSNQIDHPGSSGLVDKQFGSDVPPEHDPNPPPDTGEELFSVIDETGEGWGFDLEPATVIKPLAITSAALFGFGLLAGIPAGLALGQTEEAHGPGNRGRAKLRPTPAGAFFALRAFTYGTLLCGTCGAAAAYATAYYYDAWTWQDFGSVMRRVVPQRRDAIDSTLSPLLNRMRRGASENLPGPMNRARDRFGESRIGIYIRHQIESAVTIPDDGTEGSTDNKSVAQK